MRLAALVLAILVAAAGPARAEPPPAAKPAEPAAKPAQPAAKPKAPAAKAPTAKPVPLQRVDLFPPAVLGDPKLRGGSGGVAEKGPGFSFGGEPWQDVAMIGALTAGFAALVGLCSGGACMLPDWLPGTPDPGGINPSSPEPDHRIRQAR